MRPVGATALAGLVLLLAASARAEPSADRGRTLWLHGAPEGTASVAGAQVPAARFPCAACHGRDAAGGGEGATRAPDVGADALRTRGFAPGDLDLALSQGRGSGGRTLDRAMPRYTLPEAARADLAAFLTEVEAERTAGVDPLTIRFACVVDPADAASLARAGAYRQAWDSLLADRRIYGRVATLAFAEGTPPELADAAFALLCLTPDAAARLADGPVPVIHPTGDPTGPSIAPLSPPGKPEPDTTRAARSVAAIRDALFAASRSLSRERVLAILRSAQ